jgi:allene oxide cyclase
MKIRFIAFPVLAIAAAMLVAWSPNRSKTTLHVVERATTDTVGDVAPAGDSVGDVLGFANEVFDAANATKVGTDNGMCVRTKVGAAWECIWTLTLSDGQLTVEGPYFDTSDSTLAITGGTGAYSSAHGEMLLHARDATSYDFIYTINK